MRFEMKTAFRRLLCKCTTLAVKLAYHLYAMNVMHNFKRRHLLGVWEKRVMFLVSEHNGYNVCSLMRQDSFYFTGYYKCITYTYHAPKSPATIVCEAYVGNKKHDLCDSSKLEWCFKSLFKQFTRECLHQDISPEEVGLKIIASNFEDEHMKLFTDVMKLHQIKRAIEVYESSDCDKIFN